MEERIARVVYVNDDKKEGYKVETYMDGEWGLDCFCPLVRRENANEDEEKNFVHFSLINKIKQLNDLGYSIVIK